MELKVLGYHARVELIIMCVVIGIVLGAHLFCSCTSFSVGGMPSNMGSVIKEAFGNLVKGQYRRGFAGNIALIDAHRGAKDVKEAFTQQTMLGSDDYGAPINYNMDNGLPTKNWENAARNYANQMGNQDNTKSGMNYKGGPIPLPPGELLIFADNKVKPECCPSYYSSSTGCVCTSQKQWDYLNQRGGNRTFSTEF